MNFSPLKKAATAIILALGLASPALAISPEALKALPETAKIEIVGELTPTCYTDTDHRAYAINLSTTQMVEGQYPIEVVRVKSVDDDTIELLVAGTEDGSLAVLTAEYFPAESQWCPLPGMELLTPGEALERFGYILAGK